MRIEGTCSTCVRPHCPPCGRRPSARLATGALRIYAFAVQSAPKHSSKVALFFLSSCFVEMCVSSCWRLAVALNVCEQHANV